ncbi:hypothetical protein LCGC14_0258520 [marine sediment metagenome]|uniref:Uncharacterized protein n=1 Tax=marine sediment metagenome TaxID=412755 RepID=A0A0F9UJ66_9ZZZZ
MESQTSAFDDFVSLAQKAAEKQPTVLRENYKTAVDRLLTEKPNITEADLLRGVLRALGVESEGADAMPDDELIRVVLAGRTVLRLHRKHKKDQEDANV